jgi:hypothetical protein
LVGFAIRTGDNQRGSERLEQVIGLAVDAESLELYACCGCQVTVTTNMHVPHNFGIRADPRPGASHAVIVLTRSGMGSP